jgi:hypothetical protein
VSSEEDVSPTCSESASARDAAQGSDHLDAEGAQSHWESSDTGDAKMSKSRRKKLRRKAVRAERLVQQAIMFCLLHFLPSMSDARICLFMTICFWGTGNALWSRFDC